ncbi:MAG: hypothetical protein K6U00_01020, partial [Armatimonadetes bacterium]|nr:hypothetical protein [Armatimonadota bacterium]
MWIDGENGTDLCTKVDWVRVEDAFEGILGRHHSVDSVVVWPIPTAGILETRYWGLPWGEITFRRPNAYQRTIQDNWRRGRLQPRRTVVITEKDVAADQATLEFMGGIKAAPGERFLQTKCTYE